MAKKIGGLGKGLNALFLDNSQQERQTISVRIAEVEPNPDQPRRNFEESELSELADSIRTHGVLQPILVRPGFAGNYRIVAGERRWRAARIAGLEMVPVIVKDIGEDEAAILAMVENLQRQDLNPVEEAQGYRRLMEQLQVTQEDIAKLVGKSRPAVANSLRLLSLPDEVQTLVESGKLTAGHARTLLTLGSGREQIAAAQEIVEGKKSVREAEKIAAERRQEKTSPAGKKQDRLEPGADTFFRELELALSQELHRKITIRHQGEKGSVEVAFYNREELADIAERLAGSWRRNR